MNINGKKLCLVLTFIFIISLVPIFIMSFFTVPQNDDFYYGIKTYHAFKESSDFFSVIRAAYEQVIKTYGDWQGTWSAVFIFALHPGVWGEKYYFITTFVLVFTLIGSTFLFTETVLGRILKMPKYRRIIFTLILLFAQIQLVPTPVQAFYWWNGSMYYTFFYSLALILFSLITLYMTSGSKIAKIFSFVGACLTAAIISGGNYVTALVTILLLGMILVQRIYKKDKRFISILVIIAIFSVGFIISATAPGNDVRGGAGYESIKNAVNAILLSFVYSFHRIYMSTSISFIAVLLLLSPIIIDCAEKSNFEFKHPIIFALVTFLLFTCQFTPPLYGMRSMTDSGSARIVNIIYFGYYWLVAANIYYIGGFVTRKYNLSVSGVIKKLHKPKVFAAAALAFTLFMCIPVCSYDGDTYKGGKLTTSSAVYSLSTGEARDFLNQWNERFDALKDPDRQNIVFKPITCNPKLLFYGDLTGDSDFEWSNLPMRLCYDKQSVVVDWS